MKFENAIEKVKGDKNLTAKFVKNPQGVLTELDVDLSDVVFGKEAEAKMEGGELKGSVSACVSVGVVVCGSVGYNT